MNRELHDLIRESWHLLEAEGCTYKDAAALAGVPRISYMRWAKREPMPEGAYTAHPSDVERMDAVRAFLAGRNVQDPAAYNDPVQSPPPVGTPVVMTYRVGGEKTAIGSSDFDRLGLDLSDGPVVRVAQGHEEEDLVEKGRKAFETFEKTSTAYLERQRENPRDLLVLEIETDGPILLANMSDLHLGARGTDHKRAREDALLVGETPGAFAVFGGDGIDNHIKHRSAIIRSGSTPEDQFAALEYYLSLFDKKLLCGVTGNHDYWTRGFAGLDYVHDIFRRLGLRYGRHLMRLVLRLNGRTEYRVYLRHNYRYKSSINLSNQFLRMWEKGGWDWDIGLIGHTHDGPFVVPFERHGRERWGGLAGSYQVKSDHAAQWGFTDATPSTPAFVLWPDEYRIDAFNDLRRGIGNLRALYGRAA